jgi:hypothetical protein
MKKLNLIFSFFSQMSYQDYVRDTIAKNGMKESILPNFDFFIFPIFIIKLGHF